MRKNLLSALMLLASLTAHAQQEKQDVFFKHLDVAFTTGSTGLGFDMTMPINNSFKIRTGGSFMPIFDKTMRFTVQVGNDPAKHEERLEKINNIMMSMTNQGITDHIDMVGSPSLNNFKFLVDYYPLKKKNFHLTAGFFLGGQRIAYARNSQSASTMLTAISMYNNMYWNARNQQPFIDLGITGADYSAELPPQIVEKFEEWGLIGMPVGRFTHDFYATKDIYYDHDEYMLDENEQSPTWGEMVLVHQRGDIAYHKGDLMYKKNDVYRMYPGKDNSVKAKMVAPAFRPYLGMGYTGKISKDGKTTFSVEAGALIWGGAPKIVTHDGVDLVHDLYKIDKQINRYVKVTKLAVVYPVIELRVAQNIF